MGIRFVSLGLFLSMLGCGSDVSQDSRSDSTITLDIGINRNSGLDEPDTEVPIVSEGRPFFMGMNKLRVTYS